MSQVSYKATGKEREEDACAKAGDETASSGRLKDEELVLRAQSGEGWASAELIARYGRKAYGIAYRMCLGDREEAQDLTQDAFLLAFRNLNKFRGDSSFYTWFYRILINTCISGQRRRRRWDRIFPFWRKSESPKAYQEEPAGQEIERGEAPDPLSALRGKQLAGDVERALMSLPEKQRVVFQLKVFQGMSIKEIAEVTGTAEGTVKSHLFRATRFLREALSEWARP